MQCILHSPHVPCFFLFSKYYIPVVTAVVFSRLVICRFKRTDSGTALGLGSAWRGIAWALEEALPGGPGIWIPEFLSRVDIIIIRYHRSIVMIVYNKLRI